MYMNKAIYCLMKSFFKMCHKKITKNPFMDIVSKYYIIH